MISKIDELRATAIDLNADIIAITETWMNDTISNPFLNIPSYKLVVRRDRMDTKDGRGGSILAYAKSNIRCHDISTPENIIQVAALQIRLDDQSLNVYITYRSPNSSDEKNT